MFLVLEGFLVHQLSNITRVGSTICNSMCLTAYTQCVNLHNIQVCIPSMCCADCSWLYNHSIRQQLFKMCYICDAVAANNLIVFCKPASPLSRSITAADHKSCMHGNMFHVYKGDPCYIYACPEVFT